MNLHVLVLVLHASVISCSPLIISSSQQAGSDELSSDFIDEEGEGGSPSTDDTQTSHNRRRLGGASSGRSTRKMRLIQRLLRQLSPREMTELRLRTDDNSRHKRHRDSNSHSNMHWNNNNKMDTASSGDSSYHAAPVIECPSAEDGMKLFACPSPDRQGIYRCIDDHALCDNKQHCPNGEDEDRTVCMFHKMTMNYFKVLMDAVFGLSRSVV